jgi:hypothetical protein
MTVRYVLCLHNHETQSPRDAAPRGSPPGLETEHLLVEGEPCFERLADGCFPSEAVPLGREHEQAMRDAAALERPCHRLGLHRGDDWVRCSVQPQHRAADQTGELQRGAGPVHLGGVGIGADQAVKLVGLECGGLYAEGFQVGDAVVADAGGEQVAGGERAEGRVATGAGADDRDPVWVDLPGCDELVVGLAARNASRSPAARRYGLTDVYVDNRASGWRCRCGGSSTARWSTPSRR